MLVQATKLQRASSVAFQKFPLCIEVESMSAVNQNYSLLLNALMCGIPRYIGGEIGGGGGGAEPPHFSNVYTLNILINLFM